MENPLQESAEAAATMLKMLASPARLMVLCRLVEGEASVGELCDKTDISQSAISQHLAKLRAEGLVDSERKGRQVFYRLCSAEARAILSTLYIIYCQKD